MSTERINEAALYGLKYAEDQGRVSLHGADPQWTAGVVASHAITAAINTGLVVTKDVHDKRVDHLKRRASRFENYWASAKVEADRQLQRVQTALQGMADRELAGSLAEQIGVILHHEEEAA